MNGQVAVQGTPDLIIPSRVNQLISQTSQLNEDITKDINSITDRIRNIGLRFNSVGHPDNSSPALSAGESKSNIPERMTADGLDGALLNVIDNGAVFINKWNNELYPALSKYLQYIEQHI